MVHLRQDRAAHERARIVVPVWGRHGRDPARDLRVVAELDEDGDVLLAPRSQYEIGGSNLHGTSL
jgi:hypothetical protein